MRVRAFAPLMIALSIAAIGAGCNSKSSSGTTEAAATASSAAGTPVRQPLGASSVGGAGTKPVPAH
jgi:hypothetical protein